MSVNNLNSLTTIPINSTIQESDGVILDSKMTKNISCNKNDQDSFLTDTSSLNSLKRYFQSEIESKIDNKEIFKSIENFDLVGLDNLDDIDDIIEDDEEIDINNKEFTRVTKYSHLIKNASRFKQDYQLDLNDDITFTFEQENDSSFLDLEDLNSNRNFYKKYSYLDSQNKSITNTELNKIYKELNEIHNKLMEEYQIIQEREKDLIRREDRLLEEEQRLIKSKDMNMQLIYQDLKSKYESELANLRNELKEKLKENKRITSSFNIVRQSNVTLKKQLKEKNEKIFKLEDQNYSLNSRLNNLQKKLEETNKLINLNGNRFHHLALNKDKHELVPIEDRSNKSIKPIVSKSQLNQNYIESLAILTELLNKIYLKNIVTMNKSVDLVYNDPNNIVNQDSYLERCCKLLPVLVDLIINLNEDPTAFSNPTIECFVKYHLVFLEFIYWCIVIFDTNIQFKKVNLSSTYRRIGDEIYKSFRSNEKFRKNEETTRTYPAIFLESEQAQIRFLSCLIILRTVKQVDQLKNIFELMRNDLKDEFCKELFLDYLGTSTILKWCKITNKLLLELSIDTFLQLCVNWKYLENFIESCSNEAWFSNMALLLRETSVVNPNTNEIKSNLSLKIIEKLSILLQKLSKIKANKKYFDMFSLNKICIDLMQRHSSESDFLTINLKSILANLK